MRLEQALFEIRRVISGQDQMLERVLVCLLTGGHLLIEGVPGLAKTLTVKTTADVLGGTFKRIQFTPDLVPSDLIGTRIYRPDSATFDTELGPVFCNFLLADEINRAPAKVQSALLEVMQERQVTLGHTTHPVPDPFLVMATQNPIESEGTYPLPEAQVDRFMLKILVDYPQHDEELTVIQRSLVAPPKLSQLLSIEDLRSVQATVRDIYVDPGLVSYALELATATRRPADYGLPDLAPLHLVRRQPARPDLADPRRPRPRGRARARLRAGAGRAGADQGRVPPPAGALVRGARRAPQRRQHARRGDRRRARAAARPVRESRVIEGLLRRGQTPARPGPGPMPEPLLRALDLTIARRVEGLLPGDHGRRCSGAAPSSRRSGPYEAVEDDVRQIDWNVTARTGTPHVRIHLAERALVTWLLLDTSASMTFGTAERRKADVAEGASLAVGYAATRRGNRLGLVTFGDDHPRTLPARQGRAGLLGLLLALRKEDARGTRRSEGEAASIGEAMRRVGNMARQRSYVVVVSDFRGPSRLAPLAARAQRPPSRGGGRDPRRARAGAAEVRASCGSSIPRPAGS